MIRLLRLRAENFLSLGSVDVPLDGQGLVLLLGQNLDAGGSNGAGKSALLSAIEYVLYEKTARGAKHDSIINTAAGDGTLIEIDLEIDQHPYRIRLARKHAKYETSYRILRPLRPGEADGEDGFKDVTAKEGAVVGQVQTLLGVPYEIFRGSSIVGQDDLHEFVYGTNLARQGFFSKLFGFDVWRECQEIARNKIRDDTMALERCAGQIDTSEAVVDGTESLEDTDLLTEQLRDLVDKAERASVRVEDLRNRCKSLDALNVKDREQLARFDERIKRQETARRIKEEVEEKKESLAKMAQRLGEYAQDPRALDERHRRIHERLVRAEAKLEELREGLRTLQGVGAQCPTCLQPLEEDTKDRLIVSIESQLTSAGQEKERYGTKARNADKLRSLMRRYEQTQAELEGLRVDLDFDVDPIERDDLQGTIRKREKEKTKIANELAEAETDLKKLSDDSVRVESRIDHIAEQEERHEVLRQKLEGLKATRAEIEGRLDLLRVAESKVFPEIRSNKIRALLSTLNYEIARYLSVLTDGRVSAAFSFKARGEGEVLDLAVEDSIKGKLPIINWSGGERKRVVVSVFFALWRLVDAVSKSFNVVGFDEILRDVDILGHGQILDVMRAIRDENRTVIVTTNADPATLDLSTFDRVWVAVKQAGLTHIVTDPVEVYEIVEHNGGRLAASSPFFGVSESASS